MKLLRMTIRAALRALRRHKLRSGLTMLGVVIGVAAVIAMVGIGRGADVAIRRQIESLGTNLLVVVPGATTASGVRSGWGGVSTLTRGDAEAIGRDASAVAAVTYVKRQIVQVVYGERNWSTAAQGTTTVFFEVRDWPVVEGRIFTTREQDTAARVAVLGRTVAEQLFGPGEDPLDAQIRVQGVTFQVIGVLDRKGQSSWGQDQDDVVVMPFSTAERRVLGSAFLGSVDQILATSASAGQLSEAQAQMTAILRERHRTQPGAEDDFTVRDLSDMARAAQDAGRVMSLLLLSVASISLLVGGIGIMNILLVSVTERTREIGIRMAVGAKRRHILLQFLVEATALGAVGGLAGAALGIAAAGLVSGIAGWPVSVPPVAVVGSILFACVVGVAFGFFPAQRAAGLDPIVALRHE
ncbi:MAG TPA: ABC transporter permease [Myxococcota bacterium]|jgi:ABC-type antimicrobial peptide transport system permease subunit|nr:ABC transporter permease [Myxococcota bacterium]